VEGDFPRLLSPQEDYALAKPLGQNCEGSHEHAQDCTQVKRAGAQRVRFAGSFWTSIGFEKPDG